MSKQLTTIQADAVYDVLSSLVSAHPSSKAEFIQAHTNPDGPDEWRFGAELGFGGKYWSGQNTVSCYPEDRTPALDELIEKTNRILANIMQLLT